MSKTPLDKKKVPTQKAITNDGGGSLQFKDERKTSANELQEIANNSSYVNQLKETEERINSSSVTQLMMRRGGTATASGGSGGGKKPGGGGKKGGSYFTFTGYTDEEIAEAEEETGKISAHGSGKSGSSGISAKTTKEKEALIGVLRKNKAKKKAARRPKAKIKNQPKQSDEEKIRNKAIALAAEHEDELPTGHEVFLEYLDTRYGSYEETQELIGEDTLGAIENIFYPELGSSED